MYKIIETEHGNIILLRQNNVLLSFKEDEKNMDYQDYLLWVAEGNIAEIIELDEA